MYFYATRLLLERVSWFCRDKASEMKLPNCEARLTFEHRRRLSYASLKEYLELLRTHSEEDEFLKILLHDVRIHWSAINISNLRAVQKPQFAGVQLADAVASGLRSALELRYQVTEHRFAKLQKPVIYAYGTRVQSYGLKFFPRGLEDSDSRKHWITKHYK